MPPSDFPRARNGVAPLAVEQAIADARNRQEELRREADSLRSRLQSVAADLSRERANATSLNGASTMLQSATDRITRMLRIAVDEVSEMQYDARVEAEQTVVTAQAEAEAIKAQASQMVADLTARQRATETEYTEVINRVREEAGRITAQAVTEAERMRERENIRRAQAEDELTAELTRLRRETEARIEEQIRSTNQECEVRLFDAKTEADRRLRVAGEQIDRRLQEARRALDDITSKRIALLEELVQVQRTIEQDLGTLGDARRAVAETGSFDTANDGQG